MELRFVFKTPSGKPRVHAKRLPIVVGRSDAADVKLRIPKDAVSRRHCEFLLDQAGTVCLQDLESTNGTFVDGRQLEPRRATPLPSGSQVRLGNVSFRVEYAAVEEEASPHEVGAIPGDSEAELPAAIGEHELAGEEAPSAFPATEPLEPQAEEPDAAGEPAAEAELAEPPVPGDFGFLAADEPEAAGDSADWPVADAEQTSGDENLEDFFKGLS